MPKGLTTVWYLGTGQVCKATKKIINDVCNVTLNRKLIKTIHFTLLPVRESDKRVPQPVNVTCICHILKAVTHLRHMLHTSYFTFSIHALRWPNSFPPKMWLTYVTLVGVKIKCPIATYICHKKWHFGVFGQTFKMLHHAYFLSLNLET